MNIKERLIRRSVEDRIHIGEVVKRTYFGEFGEVFKAITDALIEEGLTYHQVNPADRQALTADRILGRLEGYQTLVRTLELAIEDADKLREPIEEEETQDENLT